jgi:oxygen-independent coproporphyrinogen-3 oxidase
MIDAMVMEIDHWRQRFPTVQDTTPEKPSIHTLYLGGGSPSLLSTKELQDLFEAIHRNFNLQHIEEITLEANPEDIHESNLRAWKNLGINRLSIGVQSLFDTELQWMNRAHSSKQSTEAVARALASGFTNLSVDLIYGSPHKSLAQWQRELDWVESTGVTHLSCYALTIEDKTVFAHQSKKGLLTAASDEHMDSQFQYLCSWAESQGWEHYEISNLCKPGHRAVHNSRYWQGHPYLGLGPSAHSFDGKCRSWNVANNQLYIDKVNKQDLYYETEILTTVDMVNEALMTGLRLLEGVSLDKLESLWPNYQLLKKKELNDLMKKGQLTLSQGKLQIPSSSRFLCDAITVELMVD